jgi:biopolymer transport protein ExbD
MRRRRSRASGLMERYASDGGLTLTSMMDILTTLLFFVLKSYVSGGEVTVPPPGVTLPRSTVNADMHTSVVVAIDHDTIMMDGEKVASVRDAVSSDELMIAPLAKRLVEARALMDDLAQKKGEKHQVSRLATIQGDAGIEFRVLQKVMYTLDRNGFPDIALAVLKKA